MAGRKFLNGIDLLKTQIVNIVLHIVAGDASSPTDGQVWYNSSTSKFRGRANGANVTLVNDGGDLSAGSVALSKLATDPLARAGHTGTQLASTISNFDTQVRTNRLDQMTAPTASVAMGGQKLTGLANGSAASDSAAFGQIADAIDAAINGRDWKEAVRVATTANGTLSTAFVNGATVDGVTLATGDRILVKNQTTASENGIRVVAASGIPPRALDADSAADIANATVVVAEGTANAGTQWTLTTDGAITLDTTALSFAQIGAGGSAYTAGNGLTLSGNDFNVGAGTGISVAADAVAIDTAVVVRKYAVAIGDGSDTSITVNHALNTRDVTVCIYRNSSPYDEVEADVEHTDANNVEVKFATAPTSNEYRVVVHA